MSRLSNGLPNGLSSGLSAARRLAGAPRFRLAARVTVWILALGYFAFGLLLLTLRYAVLPQIENYRGEIEQAISRAAERPISIRQIRAHWEGLHPTLTLNGFAIRDANGQTALGFEQIEIELSWKSLLVLKPRLARIELDAPNLVIRRDRQGRYFVASLEVTPQQDSGEGAADWLLRQDRILVRNATIVWQDELRGAPPLELRQLNFQMDNSGSRHRFGLTAQPPRHLAAKLDLRGDLTTPDLDRMESWKGEAYTELHYADLAGWHAWLDYPLPLVRGSGALRVWLGFANSQVTSATADIRLADVQLSMTDALPRLPLTLLEGRLRGKRVDTGFVVETRQLSLLTATGVQIPPTDLRLEWHGAGGKPAQGTARINVLDIDALVGLAAYLPLPDSARARLAQHAPRGKLADVELAWKLGAGESASLDSWQLAGRFENLGLAPVGDMPGIAGMSGRIEGSHKSGRLVLASKASSLDLPTLLPEARIELESLDMEANWKVAADGLHVSFGKARFSNRDADGEASGTWHQLAEGPGAIDMTARLNRARADSVWRYLPFEVGKDTPLWLKASIKSGQASDVTLKLRGDLLEFPFRQTAERKGKAGLFEVRGRFQDGALKYADGWPEISGIDGELLFLGEHMRITARKARMLGVAIRDVTADIADLEHDAPQLEIAGKAAGPTADFLRFIESSPIGEQIDHFTEDMRADGSGELDLKLHLPLAHIEQTRINGSYRFAGNTLHIDADLPPVSEVNGLLRFTEDSLEAKGLSGRLLGGPMNVDIKTLSADNIQVMATGECTALGMRQQYGLPLFDQLSGGFKWNGQIRARKKGPEIRITSNLVGLSSSLPDPFNKTATDAVPLTFERKPPPEPARAKPPRGTPPAAARDLVEISLGRSTRVQLLRQTDTDPPRILRGLVAVGDPTATLPERALQVSVSVLRIPLDSWRSALTRREGPARSSTSSPTLPTLPALQFSLRTNELAVQDRMLHDVRLTGNRPDAAGNPAAITRIDLRSRELTGNFEWSGAGKGKLTGRIDRLAVPETPVSTDSLNASASDVVRQLPALDITVDQLLYKDKPVGTVRVSGENRNDYWHSKIEVKNEDGTLEAAGRWRPSLSEPDTQVEFKLAAKSVEKLLNRVGYPDAMKRGTANVSGNLSWSGAPYALDYPSLNGKLTVAVNNGQFSQLEPGVGRLLGILSLQSLPRRITLDFRDIFSQGFAFDSINGEFSVAQGTLETLEPKNLQINGPSAKVVMDGRINLGNETQDLHVRVQPAVGESVAVGAMLTNPVVGAAVWAAQKLLNDPFGQAFAFDYKVSGSWTDPKVEKLAAPKAGDAKPVEQKK